MFSKSNLAQNSVICQRLNMNKHHGRIPFVLLSFIQHHSTGFKNIPSTRAARGDVYNHQKGKYGEPLLQLAEKQAERAKSIPLHPFFWKFGFHIVNPAQFLEHDPCVLTADQLINLIARAPPPQMRRPLCSSTRPVFVSGDDFRWSRREPTDPKPPKTNLPMAHGP